MTATTRRPKAARSTKIRPEASPDPDEGGLGRFPPPTEWSEQLAVNNLQLAASMAARMAQATRMPFEDLHLEATKGLLKGCRYYDPSRINPESGEPYKLSTCVVPFIRGAMAQYLRIRGHSSGVKFPIAWRDKAPIVRRMAADGATLEAVVLATGLDGVEVEAILQAQGVTTQVDPDSQGFATYDPDPWDDVETCDALADVLAIADLAHAFLREADRNVLERSWESSKRRQLARLPHGQFLVKARGIIRGRENGNQPKPPAVQFGPQMSLDIFERAEAAVNAEIGKTASAELLVDGETSGNQPSNRQGRIAELSSSDAGGSDAGSGVGGGLLGAVEGISKDKSSTKRGRRTRQSV